MHIVPTDFRGPLTGYENVVGSDDRDREIRGFDCANERAHWILRSRERAFVPNMYVHLFAIEIFPYQRRGRFTFAGRDDEHPRVLVRLPDLRIALIETLGGGIEACLPEFDITGDDLLQFRCADAEHERFHGRA